MFQERYDKLKAAIDEIIIIQNNVKVDYDRAEAELRSTNQAYQKAVLEKPGADHSEIEGNIIAIEKRLQALAKKLNALPRDPDEKTVAMIIAGSESEELRNEAVAVMLEGIKEINEVQEQINRILNVELPGLKKKSINLAAQAGSLERQKATIFNGLKFVRECCPDHQSSRYRPPRSIEWPQIIVPEDEAAKSFDAAK